MKMAMEIKEFNYELLKQLPHKMFFMTGSTKTKFDCLFECVEPFLDTIIYPDCKDIENSLHLRKLDKKTELTWFFNNLQTCIAPWGDGLDDSHQFINNVQDLCWLVCVSE